MRPWTSDFAGRFEHATIDSAALRANPLGDAAERPLWVYLPPAYDADPAARYPVIYLIQGYTGTLGMWGNRSPFRPTVLELVDDLFAGTDAPPALVVGVDAWTAYGGSQFVDSPGTGRYHTYLCDEVVPFVDARWRTLADRESRAITGKSSGGFGAMITPMLRPDLFGAFASHAGDALYELCYIKDFGEAARTAAGRVRRVVRRLLARLPVPGGVHQAGGRGAGRACTGWRPASPRTRTGRCGCRSSWRPGGWWSRSGSAGWTGTRSGWCRSTRTALRSLRAVWVDAGRRDEYFLDLGAQAFVAELGEDRGGAGVRAVRRRRTRQIEYRYPLALRFLAERLAR